MGLAVASSSDAGDGAGDGNVADEADNAVDIAICNSSLPSAASCNDPPFLDLVGTPFIPPFMYGVARSLCTADDGPIVSTDLDEDPNNNIV
eukprot:6178580-Pleurochrysis_carterae.AAC.1